MALFGRGESGDALVRRLEGKSYGSIEEKREMLTRLAAEGAVRQDVLLRFLLSDDADLGRFAVEQFRLARDARAVDPLLSALGNASRGHWRPLVLAIHALESPLLLDRLAQMLSSKRVEHRLLGMEVLAAHPAAHGQLNLLKSALRDPEDPVRLRAIQILQGGAAEQTVQQLLREQLSNPDDLVRQGAILVLAQHPDPELIEPFFDLLPNEPARVQDAMIRGLGRLLRGGGVVAERVLERMLPLLAADDERVRDGAAKLLGAMPDKHALLRRFLQYAKGLAFWLRDRSFSAIAKVSEDMSEAVRVLLEDEDVDVVVGATVMAGKSRDARLLPGLVAVLDRSFDWWVKIPTLETIATYREPLARATLLQALEVEELRPAALACLGVRAEPETMADVLRFLGHERRGLRRAALEALRPFRDPVLLTAFEQIARNDADIDCRMVALEALDDFGAQGVALAESIRIDWRRQNEPGQMITDLRMVNSDPNPLTER